MSGNNVYAEIAKRSNTLADRLDSNNDLANVILAILGRIIILCNQRSRPIEGIAFTPLLSRDVGGDVEFVSTLSFYPFALRPPSLWAPQNDFAQFCAARAQGLAMALGKNPNLCAFFQSLAEAMESYADAKGLSFSDLRLKNPFISKDDVLVLRVGKDIGNA